MSGLVFLIRFFMSRFLLLLQTVHLTVHQNVHLLTLKKYTEPKIYTGGVNILLWNKLTKKEQAEALSKDWYIYYKYADKVSGKLIRMPNIKAGANRFKTKNERIKILGQLRDNLEYLLEKGYVPYEDNDFSDFEALNTEKEIQTKEPINTKENTIVPVVVEPEKPIVVEKIENQKVIEPIDEPIEPVMSIKEAIEFALKIKKGHLNDTSYLNLEGRIKRFMKSFDQDKPVTSITRKATNLLLNEILENSSARNRNNTRIDLSSVFEVLANNEIIPDNFIKKINVIKTKPERNKTYTPEMQTDIYSFLEKNDPILLLFVKFVSYNFLRPVEVCRLKVGDLDIADRKLYVKAKNKAVKIKIIPEILLKELPDLSGIDKNQYLFTPTKIGGEWDATENNRRDNFSKRFKSVVKEHFNLGIDYGMYSFRHTFITKLYRELRKKHSPFEAKSNLLLITGHSTMTSLEQYLRDIDAELPEDYSHLF